MIFLEVTMENVEDVFGTQCILPPIVFTCKVVSFKLLVAHGYV